MKLRVTVDGEVYTLDAQLDSSRAGYRLNGATNIQGEAGVVEIAPGVYSVLVNSRSQLVHVTPHPQGFEVRTGLQRHLISLADPRDTAALTSKPSARGPVELRAQMPGKIIKLLMAVGDHVKSGQGLVVVEAMKMQNEVKSPRDGTVAKIHVVEGATVAAGELLMVVA